MYNRKNSAANVQLRTTKTVVYSSEHSAALVSAVDQNGHRRRECLRNDPGLPNTNPGTVHEDGRVEPPLGRHYVQAYDVLVAYSHK